jgi:hypothetical protein
MKIPKPLPERHQFFQELIAKCNATTEVRREFYKQMRSYFLFGCEDRALSQITRYNKIYSHIDTLRSFMFIPESTRFSINIGASVNADEQDKVPAMVQRMHQTWHEADMDKYFKQALMWSAPYGKVMLKFRPRVWKRIGKDKQMESGMQIQVFLVEPHNFGVLREDKDDLYRQEAFCETFYISKTELRNQLVSGNHKNVEGIVASVQAGHSDDALASAIPVDRLIVTSLQGDAVTGNASVFQMPLSTVYRPTIKEELVRGFELYVYDDDIADWRVVTYLEPGIPVWDRALEDIFLPGRLPYVEVCLNPAYDYFWGHSEVERLIPLQDMRNERMADIAHILRKQAHPPTTVTGAGAIPDEMSLAMDTPSGLLALESPAAEAKSIAPELPSDLWHDVEVIDAMFDEISGLSAVNQGRGTAGVRSEGHASLLSQLGSTRIKDRALTAEDSLDDCADLLVAITRRYDPRELREEGEAGAIFMANQFTDDYEAKVDGHSSSPIFTEDAENKSFKLFELKVIDGEELLDLIEIPMRPALKKRLREKIEPAQAEAEKRAYDLKMASIMAKRSSGGKGPSIQEQMAAQQGAKPNGAMPPVAPNGQAA